MRIIFIYQKLRKNIMEGFFNFIGQNLSQLCAPFNSLIIGSLLFNLVLGLLLIPLYERTVQNYFISTLLKDQYKDLRKRHGGEKMSNELIASSGFALNTPYIIPVLQSLFAVIYAFSIRTEVIKPFIGGRFELVLTMNPIEIFNARQSGMAFLTFMLSIFVFLSYFVIVRSEYVSLVDFKKARIILLAVQSALALLLPVGYGFALMVYEIIDFLDFYLSTTKLFEKRKKKASSKMNIEMKAFKASTKEEKEKAPSKKGYKRLDNKK